MKLKIFTYVSIDFVLKFEILVCGCKIASHQFYTEVQDFNQLHLKKAYYCIFV